METATIIVMVVLLIVLWMAYKKTEHYTIAERVAMLEKRINDLYSGGADLRQMSIPTSTNQ